MGIKMKTGKPICAMYLIMLCFLQETSSSSSSSSSLKSLKLRQMEAKLEEMQPPLGASLRAPQFKRDKRRVLYPTGYGADPTGKEESSESIMKAVNDAFEVADGLELLPGVNDMGGVVIDLQGGNYKINKPLRFPPSGGANLVMQGGTLRASDDFPEDGQLVQLWSPKSKPLSQTDSIINAEGLAQQKQQASVGIYYEDITFRDVVFDSRFRGGGIFIIDSARIRIHNCYFVHFKTQGILVQKGHETFVSGCFLGQRETVGGDPGEKDFTGTAIELAGNDNAVTDVAIFSGALGVLLKGQANIITGVHCYNKATYWEGIGILVKQNAALTRIDNCYLDYNSIVIEDPTQVHVTNGLFLGDGNVVLKAINGKISGVNIVNNMFTGDPKRMSPIVKLQGSFRSIDQVVIDHNNVNGMSMRSTVGRSTASGSGTKWVLDFSRVLVFPDRITHFHYSFYGSSGNDSQRIANHRVTNVSNNVVVVESDIAVNGVVSAVVDQYNLVGEQVRVAM